MPIPPSLPQKTIASFKIPLQFGGNFYLDPLEKHQKAHPQTGEKVYQEVKAFMEAHREEMEGLPSRIKFAYTVNSPDNSSGQDQINTCFDSGMGDCVQWQQPIQRRSRYGNHEEIDGLQNWFDGKVTPGYLPLLEKQWDYLITLMRVLGVISPDEKPCKVAQEERLYLSPKLLTERNTTSENCGREEAMDFNLNTVYQKHYENLKEAAYQVKNLVARLPKGMWMEVVHDEKEDKGNAYGFKHYEYIGYYDKLILCRQVFAEGPVQQWRVSGVRLDVRTWESGYGSYAGKAVDPIPPTPQATQKWIKEGVEKALAFCKETFPEEMQEPGKEM